MAADTDPDREILDSFLANATAAEKLRQSALADLDAAVPVLIEALNHESGQTEKVRQILWSLYTCSHLVPLGSVCSGLDTALAKAVSAAVAARLLAGGEIESRLQVIFMTTGELARCDEAESIQATRGLPLCYPLPLASPARLRDLSKTVETSRI